MCRSFVSGKEFVFKDSVLNNNHNDSVFVTCKDYRSKKGVAT